MTRGAGRLAAFLISISLSIAGVAQAQVAPVDRSEAIARTADKLDEIDRILRTGSLAEVRDAEADVRRLLRASRDRLAPINAELDAVRAREQVLPPAPAEGDVEPEAIASRRAELVSKIESLTVQRAGALANIEHASGLLTSISAKRIRLVYGELLKRSQSILDPSLWRAAAPEAAAAFAASGRYLAAWREEKRRDDGLLVALAILGAALIAAIAIAGPAHRWLRREIVERIEPSEPTWGRRVAIAGVVMIARLVPGLIGGFIVFTAAREVGLLGADGAGVAQALWFSLAAFLLVEGFTTGILATGSVKWRLVGVDADRGREVRRLLLAIVAIAGLKLFLVAVAVAAVDGEYLTRALDGAAALIVGVFLFRLCRRSLWRKDPAATDDTSAADLFADGEPAAESTAAPTGGAWKAARRIGSIFALLIIAATLAGYIDLAAITSSRVYFAALVLTGALFLREAGKLTIYWFLRRYGAGEAADDEGEGIAKFWVGLLIDSVLLVLLAPAAFVLAGFSWRSVRELVAQAFFGVRIGNITISFADIALAIGLFIGVIMLTRVTQRGLVNGPLAHSRIDPGVQNSLTTIVGYVGLVVAFIVGVTAMGFNLSNLAIIAGALSVGIGFGLQSIVNNFVSGLILLFERPIKVGDWVVTASGEGIVRKISVRSTEIETFDRSSIIVPNSELISSTVTNLTHKNAIGRVTIPVGVAYGSDPEKVREILLNVANEHPLILRHPEPFVVWQDFGASSLDFELRGFLGDISKGLQTRTDLRFAIFRAFREAGIEIPFPQQDLYIKSWPPFPDGANTATSG